jgi:hypothetical protein
MRAALDILKRAQAAGVTVAADGEQLRLKAPKEPPTELIEELRAHKAELLALLATESSAEAIQIKTWERPEPLPLTTDEAAARISSWLEAMDRLPKSCKLEGSRLKAMTEEFALGPWSYACVQSGWSDLALFHFSRGLIPEMSRRPLHFRCIGEDAIVLINSKGAHEDWRRQYMPDDAVPWWEDERCVGRLH